MIRWVWNREKERRNIAKHGIGFEAARRAIDDPFAMTAPDPHRDGDRWQVVGKPAVAGGPILFVVHTEPMVLNGKHVGRIISARRATPREKVEYEEG